MKYNQHLSASIQITENCTQNCKHCILFKGNNSKKNQSHMSLENFKIIFFKLKQYCNIQNKDLIIRLIGGDPLLHPDFLKIIDFLYENNTLYRLMCNPYLISEELCKKIQETNCQRIALSIDGKRETHDANRELGSYDITFEKIKMLKKYNLFVELHTTIMEQNIDEIPDLIDIAIQNKVDIFSFERYIAVDKNKPNKIPPLKYREFIDKYYKKVQYYHSQNLQIKFETHDGLKYLYLYEEGILKIPENILKNTFYSGCTFGFHNYVFIDIDGNIYSCGYIEDAMQNIYNDDWENMFNSYKIHQYQKPGKFSKCSKCELLAFCRGCPAVNYKVTNDFYSPDPQCWKEI